MTYRDVLGRRGSRRIFYVSAISGFGDSLVPVALAYAVLDKLGSLFVLGLALAAARVPATVLTLAGGVVGDRRDPRRLAVATSTVSGALNVCSAGALALLPPVPAVSVLVASQLLAGVSSSFASPAVAKLPRLLFPDEEEVRAAAGLAATLRSTVQVAAQAASGILVLAGSSALCFLLNAATFFVYAALLPRTPQASAGVSRGRSRGALVGEFLTGWRAVRADSEMSASIAGTFLQFLLMVQPFLTLTPAVLKAADGAGSSVRWGLIGACFGVGGIVGGLWAARLRPSNPIAAALSTSMLDVPVLLVLAVAPGSAAVYPLTLVSGMQSAISRIIVTREVYRRFDTSVLSRIQSLVSMSWLLPSLLGAILSASIAGLIGARPTFALLTCVFIPANLVLIASTRVPREMRNLNAP